MKMFVTLLVALTPLAAPMLARADKNFAAGKGGAWDCTKDPVVNINHGNGTYQLSGKCTTINLNGGNNKLTIESVETINGPQSPCHQALPIV